MPLNPHIAIVGAGIIGMTNALLLLEKGYEVTIFSEDHPLATNSDAAVALWWPSSKPFLQQLCLSSLKKIFELSQLSGSGVTYIPSRYYFRNQSELVDSVWLKESLQQVFKISVEIPEKHIKEQSYSCLLDVQVPLMDVNLYRPYLLKNFYAKGGRLIIKSISDLSSLCEDYNFVINCAGWKAKFLTMDHDVHPVRGQIEIADLSFDFSNNISLNFPDRHSYLIFRMLSRQCVIGTTYQINDACNMPRASDKSHIIKQIAPFFPAIDSMHTTSHVGIRCGRSDVRISQDPNTNIIHCYGHGGSGYSASWGSANFVWENFINQTYY